MDTLRGSRSPAVLMAKHGPLSIGRTAQDAVKAAVLCEDCRRSVHVSRQLGEAEPIGEDHVGTLYDRYQHVDGQPQA